MFRNRSFSQASGTGFSNDRPVLIGLIASNIIIFILQDVIGKLQHIPQQHANPLVKYFALYTDTLSSLQIWSIVTYSFLHDQSSILHILFNLLVIYFSGRILEPMLGSKKFATLYFSSVALGGLLWMILSALAPATQGISASTPLIGASAGALGLLVYTCFVIGPDRPVVFLLFFVIPVKLKPKWVVWFLVISDGLGLLSNLFNLSSISPTTMLLGASSNIAHEAHLGGMLASFLLYRMHANQGITSSGDSVFVEQPKWFKKKTNFVAATKQKFKVKMSMDKQELEKEVDRILDKINQEGFGALTVEERETLDKARDYLKR